MLELKPEDDFVKKYISHYQDPKCCDLYITYIMLCILIRNRTLETA